MFQRSRRISGFVTTTVDTPCKVVSISRFCAAGAIKTASTGSISSVGTARTARTRSILTIYMPSVIGASSILQGIN